MATEIERKFLVRDDGWRSAAGRARRYRQGYIADSEQASVRVRSDGSAAWLNIKSACAGRTRTEYEYPLPLTDAETMLDTLCGGRRVEKTRHWIAFAGHTWEVDEFEGDNGGLVVAEIELSNAQEAFEHPAWLGPEVTDDLRYYNNYLASHPYRRWQDHD